MTRYSCFSLLYAILVLYNCSPVKPSSANIDKLGLLAFKSQITRDPYGVMNSWNDSSHLCGWQGIQCGRLHPRVTVLKLRSCGLEGTLSPHLGNLSFLRTIDLKNNSLNGEIPQELGRLLRLKTLSLMDNSLEGEIPVTLGKCISLKTLFLDRNNLVGKIPVELGDLPNIVEMVLESNLLTGKIPSSLGNLTSLELLSLSWNNLGGSIPNILGQLKGLHILSLGQCNLSGTFPSSLYNLSSLQILSINANQLVGNLPSNIGLMLPNIEIFYIGGNQFSGLIPNSLFNASKLNTLDISINQFSGKVPLNVGNAMGLRVMYLGANNLGGGKTGDLDFFASLINCTNLEELQLSFNQFGGPIPISIANFSTSLSNLRLDGNHLVGNIPIEIGKLQNLISLDLTSNLFTGSIPMVIQNLEKLQVLQIGLNQLTGHNHFSTKKMPSLYYLDLSRNNLEGSISSFLENKNLQILILVSNNFTDPLPNQEIGYSSRLRSLELSNNSITGPIPSKVGTLKNLELLDVTQNMMGGQIPSTVGLSSNLAYLYMGNNSFEGSLPPSLASLKSLQVLDVSHNNLTGEISSKLGDLLFLVTLNLSFNNFNGELPTNGIFRNASAVSVVGNDRICGGIRQLKLPKCNVPTPKNRGLPISLKVSLGVLIPSILVVAFFLVTYLRNKPKENLPSQEQLGDHCRISYNDLHKATDGFSLENVIGVGSYGTVFKGVLRQTESPIAVKVFNLTEHRASKSFFTECEAMREIRHRNLVKIVSVCSSVDFSGNDFKALVLEYMPNGSLQSWLHQVSDGENLPKSLSFHQRLNIGIDIAFSLDYLHNHCEKPLVHCDLKSSNILLNADMSAYVGDFGLATFLSKNISTSMQNGTTSAFLRGTIGYIPPEYGIYAEATREGDVYSYGILLLEMFTGKQPTHPMFKDGITIRTLCKTSLPHQIMNIIDSTLLPNEIDNSKGLVTTCLELVLEIGIACSADVPNERIGAKDALKQLLAVREVLFKTSDISS